VQNFGFDFRQLPLTCFCSFEMEQNILNLKSNLLNVDDWPICLQNLARFGLLNTEKKSQERVLKDR